MSILDTVAPVKEIRLKQRSEPWMTSEIIELIKLRDTALYNFKKTRTNDNFAIFTMYRKRLQYLVKSTKAAYFSNKVEEHKHDSKGLWHHLKSLGYKTKTKSSSNIVLNINDEICHDSSTVANHFNTFFTTVASSLVDKLPSAKNIFTTGNDIFKSYYCKKKSENTIFRIKHVSEEFVYKELCKLNASKSTGLDGIPARFVKDGASVLKIPVTFIVNMSIDSGVVPDDMKAARVTPIYKKSSPLEVGNYRPVSILSVISKILERSIYNQLSEFLTVNSLLYEFQSGFRSKYSTDTCLIHLLDFIKGNNAKGLYTGMVLLDLQKAFDTVDHSILYNKLHALGVESIDWFKSYLTDRTQLVHTNKVSSNSLKVTCGVPQGSILGPLLFLCYVNDMPTCIDTDCKLILYADDSVILFAHKDPATISNKLSRVMDNCSTWLIDNKLSLHLGKTECMLFGSARKLKKIQNFHVSCNGHTIPSQDQVKYLGLTIDCTLNCEAIIDNIVKRVNSRVKFLYRHCKNLSLQTKQTLTNALVQCHFDYTCSSWYAGLTKKLQGKLQVAQNKVIRFLLDLPSRTSITCNELESVQMLKVNDRARQLRLNHVFNIYNGKAPKYLENEFVRVSSFHSRTRFSTYNFKVPLSSGSESGTFYSTAIHDWNALPNNIKAIKSKQGFQLEVKRYLNKSARDRENSDSIYY